VDQYPEHDTENPRLDHFALGRGMWAMTVAVYIVLVLVAAMAMVGVFTELDGGSRAFVVAWTMGLLVSGYFLLVRKPRRIDIVGDGLRFVAPTKTVVIRWTDLRSVSSPWHDINRRSLRWESDGRRVETWGPYGEPLDRLLHLISQKAPAADLRKAVTRKPTWLFHGRRRR